TVDEDGNVISARAISGHPLLKDAAVAAAREWVFEPTTLSGTAVKVIGTITFNFNLGKSPAQDDSEVNDVTGGVPGGVPGEVPGRSSSRDGQQSRQGRMIAGPGGLLKVLEQSGYRYSKVG